VGPADEAAVLRVLRNGWLSTGAEVEAFEREFADHHGARYGIAVNSCSAALHLALLLTDADMAVIPAMTFIATATSALHSNLRIQWVDIDPQTGLMDLQGVAHPCFLPETRQPVLIPVHYAGNVVDQTALAQLQQGQRKYAVVQDAAHAPGVPLNYSLGPACYSFYATKNLTTCGEGGMILTDDQELYEKATTYRLHGMSRDAYRRFDDCRDYDVTVQGYKYNMSDVSAAMGRVQLARLEEVNRVRRSHIDQYRCLLDKISGVRMLHYTTPNTAHLVPIQVENRNAVRQHLFNNGINTGLHYRAVNSYSYFPEHSERSTPLALHYGRHTLSLPLWYNMAEHEINHICNHLELAINATTDDTHR
jgi:dTDP-4-amino-4,6-dideoxygalactose transaminase